MKKEIRILGRILSCNADGWAMEADPNLIENAVCKLGLEDAKGVASPGVKREDGNSACDIRSRRNNPVLLDDPDVMWPARDTSPLLDYEHTKLYQSVGDLLNFVAMDRPDLLYSVKEVMRHMSQPTVEDMTRLKRIIRYIRTVPRWAAQISLAYPIQVHRDLH